ncbi:hypothetical protein SAMN05216436_10792 [bacterium A37T11]|nr:hypothetical protein SAMN05216436_10792 [bacterium A37T11]
MADLKYTNTTLFMKRIHIISLIILSPLFHACTGNGGRTGSETKEPSNHGSIGFTWLGQKINCDSSSNTAYFNYVKESKKYSTLIIQGINKKLPKQSVNALMLEMITEGDLKEGSYPIINSGDLALCLAGKRADSCNQVASGALRATDNFVLTYNSVGKGQLTISKLDKGPHQENTVKGKPGYILGSISGTFTFAAKNIDESKPHDVAGNFDQVPIKIYDKE